MHASAYKSARRIIKIKLFVIEKSSSSSCIMQELECHTVHIVQLEFITWNCCLSLYSSNIRMCFFKRSTHTSHTRNFNDTYATSRRARAVILVLMYSSYTLWTYFSRCVHNIKFARHVKNERIIIEGCCPQNFLSLYFSQRKPSGPITFGGILSSNLFRKLLSYREYLHIS